MFLVDLLNDLCPLFRCRVRSIHPFNAALKLLVVLLEEKNVLLLAVYTILKL
jgi:hypothetical protein